MNLSSLALGRGQNLRVHNLVSLANVQGTNQCIALPISLMMTAPPNSAPQSNNQPNCNLNGNVVVGLQDTSTDHQTTNQPQNVVLINNIDHTANQIAYQPHQTAQFSIGSTTLGSLNCRLTNQNIQHTTNLQPNLQLKVANDTEQQVVEHSGGLNQPHFTTANYNQHSIVNSNLQGNQPQGPIAIHLTAANPLTNDQTQQPTAIFHGIGSQQVLTLNQKNN